MSNGVPAGAVNTVPQAFAQPHVAHRRMLIEQDGHRAPGIPVKLSETPGRPGAAACRRKSINRPMKCSPSFEWRKSRERTMKHRDLMCPHGAALAALSAPRRRPIPAKPVELIVPYQAGRAPMWRPATVAEHLGKALGQQSIVDNKPGAGGNIGTEAAAPSPADGYTLLMGTNRHADHERVPVSPRRL